MLLDEKVAVLARVLGKVHVPHAFGGAIALAYYATRRGTRDVVEAEAVLSSALGDLAAGSDTPDRDAAQGLLASLATV